MQNKSKFAKNGIRDIARADFEFSGKGPELSIANLLKLNKN